MDRKSSMIRMISMYLNQCATSRTQGSRLRRRWNPYELVLLLLILFLALGLESISDGGTLSAGASLIERVRVAGTYSPASTHTLKTSVRIFLVAMGDNGRTGRRIGCGDSLIPVTVRVPPTAAPLRAALLALLRIHQRFYGQSGLYDSLFQNHLRLVSLRIVAGRATVRLAGKLFLGGVCDDPRVEAQLRQTVLQFPSVRSAAIFLNGIPLRKAL